MKVYNTAYYLFEKDEGLFSFNGTRYELYSGFVWKLSDRGLLWEVESIDKNNVILLGKKGKGIRHTTSKIPLKLITNINIRKTAHTLYCENNS